MKEGVKHIRECPNFDKDDKYKTIWVNQLEPLVEALRKGTAESKNKDKEESFFCPCGRKPQEEGQPSEKPVVKEN